MLPAFADSLVDNALLKKVELPRLRIRLLLDGGDQQRMKLGMLLLNAPRDLAIIRTPLTRPPPRRHRDRDATDDEAHHRDLRGPAEGILEERNEETEDRPSRPRQRERLADAPMPLPARDRFEGGL